MILEQKPTSTQNPLLSTSEFFKHCRSRFRWINSESTFVEWLETKLEEGAIQAAFSYEGTSYFLTYQVWQIDRLVDKNFRLERSTLIDEFEKLLRLLTKIQDFYLPEIRSNQRFGRHDDYRGKVAIGGTHFKSETQGGFNRSSQHVLVVVSLAVLGRLRLGSSSLKSFSVGSSVPWRRRLALRARIVRGRCRVGSTV